MTEQTLTEPAAQFGVAVSAYLSARESPAYWRPALRTGSIASDCFCSSISVTLGTALCAFAPNYHLLLLVRIVTGLSGGVIGSVVLAIIPDLFVLQVRGRVMGFVQTAFAASLVLGIPAGLFLSNHWNWHVALGALVALSIAGMTAVLFLMKPVNGHLSLKQDKNALSTPDQPRYWMAFAVTTLLATGGYMVMPFDSAYTVHNLGIDVRAVRHATQLSS